MPDPANDATAVIVEQDQVEFRAERRRLRVEELNE